MTMELRTNMRPGTVRPCLRCYKKASLVNESVLEHTPGTSAVHSFAGADWKLNLTGSEEGLETRWNLTAEIVQGTAQGVSAGWRWDVIDWSGDAYVLVPGAVYAGNRFASVSLRYSPKLPEHLSRPQGEIVVADIPRLNKEPGGSRLQLLSSDMAAPIFAWFDPRQQRGAMIILPTGHVMGQGGFDFHESPCRRNATLTAFFPGVRERRYNFGAITTDGESPDRGADWIEGNRMDVSIRTREFVCRSVQELFDTVFDVIRNDAGAVEPVPPVLPFSEAHRLIEEHYQRDFWWPEAGLFRTDAGVQSRHAYQTGWCGGLLAQFALLANSHDRLTKDRCRTHLENALTQGIAPGGLFYGRFRADTFCWDADDSVFAATHPWRKDYTLTRRQGDALAMTLKTMALLESREGGDSVPVGWHDAARRNAHVLCEIWKRHGQWGQFLHQTTGEVLVGGSTSGAGIPGALALASQRFEEPEFLDVALEAAGRFVACDLGAGVTVGGPGDALQAPDSESCAALVDSLVALWEVTGDSLWIDHASAAARQLATWVMPCNFTFPSDSEFGRLDLKTLGTVFANAQNKHSSPGLCTASGVALLKIFRVTGDVRYLDLLRDIARALPQFVSRPDRPILAKDGRALPSGWVNERVNTGDWDDNVGGVFYGPCWCEVSLMLTYAEVPGVYAQPDTGLIRAFDHVEAGWNDSGDLQIHNPTGCPARVRVCIETSDQARNERYVPAALSRVITVPTGATYLLGRSIRSTAGGTVMVPGVRRKLHEATKIECV